MFSISTICVFVLLNLEWDKYIFNKYINFIYTLAQTIILTHTYKCVNAQSLQKYVFIFMYSSHWLAPHSHMFGLANPNVQVCVRRAVPDIVDYTLEDDDDDDAAFHYIVCSLLCVLADIFGWSLCVKKALLPHTNCKVFFIFIIRILCVDTSFIYYYLIIITQDYGSDVDKVKVKKE